MSLNYVGIGIDSAGISGDNVLSATGSKSIVDGFTTTRSKIKSFIQDGWAGGFEGTNSYIATTSANPQQNTLSKLLDYKNNVLNRCIQSSTVATEMAKYVKWATMATDANQVGVANGVASLDSNKKVPLSQMPSLGGGYLIGPLGVSKTYSGSARAISATPGPLKFAEWEIQANPVNFQPLVFMVVNAQTDSLLGRSVIEVRLSSGPVTSYSIANPLVAMGTGRSYFTAIQPIAVMPCAASRGQTPSSYPPTYNTYLTAWLYDTGSGESSIGSSTSAIVSAAAFLVQVPL